MTLEKVLACSRVCNSDRPIKAFSTRCAKTENWNMFEGMFVHKRNGNSSSGVCKLFARFNISCCTSPNTCMYLQWCSAS